MQVDLDKYMQYIEIVDIGYWRIKKGTPKKIAKEIRKLFKEIRDYDRKHP